MPYAHPCPPRQHTEAKLVAKYVRRYGPEPEQHMDPEERARLTNLRTKLRTLNDVIMARK